MKDWFVYNLKTIKVGIQLKKKRRNKNAQENQKYNFQRKFSNNIILTGYWNINLKNNNFHLKIEKK